MNGILRFSLVGLMALAAPAMAAPGAPDSCTVVSGEWSNLDAAGHLQMEVRLPNQPWRDLTAPRTETFCLSFMPGEGHQLRITKVRTFWGTDRGHIGEARLHVTVAGYQLVTRSEHKEVPGIYDAWREEPADYVVGGPTTLMVSAGGWPTTAAPITMEFGVIVEMTYSNAPLTRGPDRRADQ